MLRAKWVVRSTRRFRARKLSAPIARPTSGRREPHHRDRSACLLRVCGQLGLDREMLLPESIPLRPFGDRCRGLEVPSVHLDRGRRVGFEVVEPCRIPRRTARRTGDDVVGAVLREEEQRTSALPQDFAPVVDRTSRRVPAMGPDEMTPPCSRMSAITWSSNACLSKLIGRLPSLSSQRSRRPEKHALPATFRQRAQPRPSRRIRSSSRRRRLLGRPSPRTALMPGAISRITGGGLLST